MKNLKRALSLALSAFMLVGMMAVGASAASFSDADKIEHTDAVNTMVALGVIKGKDTGDFDPEGTITRAEMTKMICVALNGGKDPNLSGVGKYPDTKGHWAAGYIDYCTNLKIVSGDTAGNFNPDRTITGTEAAKMILIAMGYNAENEKFVNDASWATNINVIASQKGLYEDVAMLPDAPLSRDNAAQMLFNGMDATMVEYDYQLTTSNGDLVSVAHAKDRGELDILRDKFNLVSEYGYMTKTTYNSTKKEYTYAFATAAYGDAIASDDFVGASMKAAADYSDLFGMKVKVLYKNNSDKTVYGMYAAGETLFEGVWKDVTVDNAKKTVKFDGTTYDMDKDYATVAFNGAEGAIEKHYAVTAIDNDGDNEVDVITYVPVKVAKVSFVGKDSISASANGTTTSYKYADNEIAEDLAKNDWVLVTAGIEKENTVAAIETVTGTVEATRTNEAKVDGTWYKTEKDASKTTFSLGNEYELVAVNGYIFNAEEKDAAAKVEDAVYTLLVDTLGTGTKAGTQTTKLLFADGTQKIVTVDKVDTKTAGTLEAPASDNEVAEKTIYTYAIDKDGNYELSTIKAKDFDKSGTVTGETAVDIEDGKINVKNGKNTYTFRFADDAVVFVTVAKEGKTETKAVSGKIINDWAKYTTKNAEFYANDKNGFTYAALGSITLEGSLSSVPGVAGDLSYGWITATPSVVKVDDTKYVELTVWTTNGAKTLLIEGNDASVYSKGTPIAYNDEGDGYINTDNIAETFVADAVIGYAGGKEIDFATSDAEKITDDTVILYVSTKDNKGYEGGEIAIADEDDMGLTVKNVYVFKDGKDVACLIVDVNNDLDKVSQGVVANVTAAPGETVKVPSAVVAPLTKEELTSDTNKDMWGVSEDNASVLESKDLAIVDVTMTGVEKGNYFMRMTSSALELYKSPADARVGQESDNWVRITKSTFNGDKELSVMVECGETVTIELIPMGDLEYAAVYATDKATIGETAAAYTFTIDASGLTAAK